MGENSPNLVTLIMTSPITYSQPKAKPTFSSWEQINCLNEEEISRPERELME
jgi:hypothetical protein